MKISIWNADAAKKELSKRLAFARTSRKRYEEDWREAERSVFATTAAEENAEYNMAESISSLLQSGDNSEEDGINTNYIMKNIRFIHSQLSANPPSVVPRPTSPDPEDRRAADAADRLVRYALRHYKKQERQDLLNLGTLIYGSAFGKCVWDPLKGDITGMSEETGEIELEGDYCFSSPSVWRIFPDPDATVWDEVLYVFEEVPLRFEDALFMFPEQKELLEKYRQENSSGQLGDKGDAGMFGNKPMLDSITVFQYWERGTPANGMRGRFMWCLEDGTVLTDPTVKSPHSFSKAMPDGSKGPSKAALPYRILTDIDIPGTYWGRSVVNFAAPIQKKINKLENVQLDILDAHGVARLLLPEGSEIADDSITNSTWDVVRYTGAIPPNFMEPLPMPQGLSQTRAELLQSLNDIMGINDAMQGQTSRETSGFSMQYATQQGNMIRRRLFNKLVGFVEWSYDTFLGLVRENWEETRVIYVLGKEKAFEAIDIKGADIMKGYSLESQYGASLSLDPMTRREEIMTLMPLFEKSGIQPRTLLGFLKLNELDSAFDRVAMSADRQREIFEEIMATGMPIAPRKIQDHQNMLAFAYDFLMTSEFLGLPENIKQLIEQHIEEREAIAAQGPAAVASAGAGAEAAGAPSGIQPPQPGGPTSLGAPPGIPLPP